MIAVLAWIASWGKWLIGQAWFRTLLFYGSVALSIWLMYLRLESQSKKVAGLSMQLDAALAQAKAQRKVLDEVERANAAAARAASAADSSPDGMLPHDPFRRD